MARVSKVETCMLCDKMPCECNKRPPKPAKFKPPKTADVPASAKGPAVSRPWVQAGAQSTDSRPGGARSAPVVVERIGTHADTRSAALRPVEDLLFEEAIRALEPLLSEQSKAEYRMILTGKLSPREAAEVWKARR